MPPVAVVPIVTLSVTACELAGNTVPSGAVAVGNRLISMVPTIGVPVLVPLVKDEPAKALADPKFIVPLT